MSGKGFLFHPATKYKKKPDIKVVSARPMAAEAPESCYESLDDIPVAPKAAGPTIIRPGKMANGMGKKDFSKSSYDISNAGKESFPRQNAFNDSGRYESQWNMNSTSGAFNAAFRMESDKSKAAPRIPTVGPATKSHSKVPPMRPPPPRPKNRPGSQSDSFDSTPSPKNWDKMDEPKSQVDVQSELKNIFASPIPRAPYSPKSTWEDNDTTAAAFGAFSAAPSRLSSSWSESGALFAKAEIKEPHGIALFDFDSDVPGDLQMKVGDVILLVSQISDEWYSGINDTTKQQGMLPSNYLTIKVPLPARASVAAIAAKNKEAAAFISSPTSLPNNNHKPPFGAISAIAGELAQNSVKPIIKGPSHSTLSHSTDNLKTPKPTATVTGGGGGGSSSASVANKIRLFTQSGALPDPAAVKPLPPPKPKIITPKPSLSVPTPALANDSKDSVDSTGSRVNVRAMAAKFKDVPVPTPNAAVTLRNSTSSIGAAQFRKSTEVKPMASGSPQNRNSSQNRWSTVSSNQQIDFKRSPSIHSSSKSSGNDSNKSTCTAVYSYFSDQPGDLNFQAGDEIEIIRQVNAEWYEGRLIASSSIAFLSNKNNQEIGLFPTSYVTLNNALPEQMTPQGQLQQQQPHQLQQPTAENNSESIGHDVYPLWMRALHDFPKQQEGDLDLRAGDLVLALRAETDDWLYGKCNGLEGQFPINFVATMEEDQVPLGKAIYDFNSEAPGDLGLKTKEDVILLEDVNTDWFQGRSQVTQRVGIFPKNFIVVVRPIPKL